MSKSLDVVLRQAREDDLAQMMPLFVELYKGDIGPGFRDVLSEYLRCDVHWVAVAVTDARIVGVLVGGYRLDIDQECRAGVIDAIVVHRGYRGQGIGKRLVKGFAAWAEGRRCTLLQVLNGRREFFERIGFVERPVRFHQAPTSEMRRSPGMTSCGEDD